MNATQAKDKLRLPAYHNEWVEITEFEQRQRGHQWPDAAVFTTGDYMKTAVVYLSRDEYPAFKHAGFDLMGKVGSVNPPIEVLILNDRVAAVKAADGTEHPVVRREATPVEPPMLHVVTNALPAQNPETGDVPTPLVFPDPEPQSRRRDDGGAPSAVPASLFIKLYAIMQEMDGVPEGGQHKQGWKFMKAPDLFKAARKAFLAHRVLVIPGVLPNSVMQTEGAVNQQGNASLRSLCVFTYTFIDVDTGQSYMTTWPGESQDYSDKGIQQSGTSSMKYMLMKMFLATPDHDPDYNTGETGNPAPAGGDKTKPMTKAEAQALVAKWEEQTVTTPQMLAALGCKEKFSEYKGTAEQANKAIGDWLNAQLDGAK